MNSCSQSTAPCFIYIRTPINNYNLHCSLITGINAVLRSLTFEPGDAILITSWTYFTMKDTCHRVSDQYGRFRGVEKMPGSFFS